MLTVTVGFDGSGTSRIRAPLSRRYSVIPSTVAIFLGGQGSAALTPFATQTNPTSHADTRPIAHPRRHMGASLEKRELLGLGHDLLRTSKAAPQRTATAVLQPIGPTNTRKLPIPSNTLGKKSKRRS